MVKSFASLVELSKQMAAEDRIVLEVSDITKNLLDHIAFDIKVYYNGEEYTPPEGVKKLWQQHIEQQIQQDFDTLKDSCDFLVFHGYRFTFSADSEKILELSHCDYDCFNGSAIPRP